MTRTHESLGTYATDNFRIFACTSKSDILYYTYQKLYGMKITINNVLTKDFLPALDSNNVPCLYDKVSKQYFYNAGTGTFAY